MHQQKAKEQTCPKLSTKPVKKEVDITRSPQHQSSTWFLGTSIQEKIHFVMDTTKSSRKPSHFGWLQDYKKKKRSEILRSLGGKLAVPSSPTLGRNSQGVPFSSYYLFQFHIHCSQNRLLLTMTEIRSGVSEEHFPLPVP